MGFSLGAVRRPDPVSRASGAILSWRKSGALSVATRRAPGWQIDPDTRDVEQNIYIRRVENVDRTPQNVISHTIENVKDPVLARLKK